MVKFMTTAAGVEVHQRHTNILETPALLVVGQTGPQCDVLCRSRLCVCVHASADGVVSMLTLLCRIGGVAAVFGVASGLFGVASSLTLARPWSPTLCTVVYLHVHHTGISLW